MPCFKPLRAMLLEGPEGRRLVWTYHPKGKAIALPCGRCIGCRVERARQWAVRIMHEAKMHDENSYLTLTLADADRVCSECAPRVKRSLCVCECQKFFKRLRERLAPKKISYFLCGEYGDDEERPHYHAVIFGYSFPDKVFSKKSGQYDLYTSKFLDEVWSLGNCWIGEVSFDSACYVANYATKKITGKDAKAHYKGRKPEFIVMSRNPAIGKRWIEKFHGDVYPSDEVIANGKACKPPRYYDQLLQRRDPDLHKRITESREKSAEVLEAVPTRSAKGLQVVRSRNYPRLAVRERVALAKASQKKRNKGEK